MKVVKKYTAIQLGTDIVNGNVKVKLSFGEIQGPYYSQISPTEEFDTEEEAIKYTYEFNKWGRWLICPLVSFDTWDESIS